MKMQMEVFPMMMLMTVLFLPKIWKVPGFELLCFSSITLPSLFLKGSVKFLMVELSPHSFPPFLLCVLDLSAFLPFTFSLLSGLHIFKKHILLGSVLWGLP